MPFLIGWGSSLRKIHLGLVYLYNDESVFQRSDCIAQALEFVSSTVERLSISPNHVPAVVGHGNTDWGESERYERVWKSLKKFTRLQTAELPIGIFLNYTPSPENHTDMSAIWPGTLRNVGLRNDMLGTHESLWDELRFIDSVYGVLLN